MTDVTSFPLCWPHGWPRTPASERKFGRFNKKTTTSSGWTSSDNITVSQALKRIDEELRAFNGPSRTWSRIDPKQTVISTNIAVRRDGLPRSDQKAPTDPGASLYFVMDGKRQCVPCDAYTKVEQNLAAIAATLSALRALERHGSGLMERAFTGFAALPHQPAQGWPEILGVASHTPTEEVDAAYRRARIAAHPDKPGGSSEKFNAVQDAYAAFKKERGLA